MVLNIRGVFGKYIAWSFITVAMGKPIYVLCQFKQLYFLYLIVYFLEVNIKYISSSVLQTSEFSRVHSTRKKF